MSEPADYRDAIARLTRIVPDFPSPGIEFKDLTPVLADPQGLRSVVTGLGDGHERIDLVAGIDARGFLLGSGVALHLGVGVLAIRKAGKLPPPCLQESYSLEYGEATLEIPANAVPLAGRRVLVVDDVLATGGTLCATIRLLQRAGAHVAGVGVVMEIAALGGRDRVLADCAQPPRLTVLTSE